MHAEAEAEIAKVANWEEDPMSLSWLGYVYALAGKKDKAYVVLERLKELSLSHDWSPQWVGVVYSGLDEKDEAFVWLDKALSQHAPGAALLLKVSPDFKHLRSDARFAELLQGANFTP